MCCIFLLVRDGLPFFLCAKSPKTGFRHLFWFVPWWLCKLECICLLLILLCFPHAQPWSSHDQHNRRSAQNAATTSQPTSTLVRPGMREQRTDHKVKPTVHMTSPCKAKERAWAAHVSSHVGVMCCQTALNRTAYLLCLLLLSAC